MRNHQSANSKGLGKVAVEALVRWISRDAATRSAALAFYSLMSLAPALVVILIVAGTALGEEAAQGLVVNELRGLIGLEAARLVQDLLVQAASPESAVPASAIGIALFLIGSTAAFNELQDALNRVWDVPPPKGIGITAYLRKNLVSFGLVVGLGGLVVVTLVGRSVVTAFGQAANELIGLPHAVLTALNLSASFVLLTLAFAVLYKTVPDAKPSFAAIVIGATATTILFLAGETLIIRYLTGAQIVSLYGATGSLVVFPLWVYYSALIVFLGAEFTRAYSQRRDSS
jgi:membrane protein